MFDFLFKIIFMIITNVVPIYTCSCFEANVMPSTRFNVQDITNKWGCQGKVLPRGAFYFIPTLYIVQRFRGMCSSIISDRDTIPSERI